MRTENSKRKKSVGIVTLTIIMAFAMVLSLPEVAFAKPVDGGMDMYRGELPKMQNAIAKQALACAWPPGTPRSVYKYGSGRRMPAYTEALSQAYGSRARWGKQTRAGASCDVFVGTVVRSCGYDTNFPRGLAQDLTYLPSSSKFQKVNVTRVADMEPGDIIMYLFKGGGGHISIYVEVDGVGYIANAHYLAYGGCYGCIDEKAHDFNPSKYKRLGIYRATGDCIAPYSEGDNSSEVKKIQEYLNWAGYSCGKADGKYGKSTVDAVKAFQEDAGLKADGKFGQECIDRATEIINDSAGTKAK